MFGGGVEDLDPPLQIFDRDVNGAAMIRQSKGRISWSAIVVPYINQSVTTDSDVWSYKLYILAYKIRKTRADDEDGKMAVTQLSELNTGYQSPLTNVLIDKSVVVPDGSLKRDGEATNMKPQMTADSKNTILVDGERIDLRNRPLAALLAWLVPGAGHFYQGRHAKGVLFLVCICHVEHIFTR